jgi:hypothetical protein
MSNRATRARRELQRANLANLATLGFRVTSIEVWRSPAPAAGLTPDRVAIGTADGGVLPGNLSSDLRLPGIDDMGGGRYPFIGYIGGTVTLAAGDELRIAITGGTVRYPVQGAWDWGVLQVAGLSEVVS